MYIYILFKGVVTLFVKILTQITRRQRCVGDKHILLEGAETLFVKILTKITRLQLLRWGQPAMRRTARLQEGHL
jgi:hypothetical protein